MILESIRREHGYMYRILGLLENDLEELKSEKPINYSLVKEIVDYLSVFADENHHPKEDLLYQYYLENFGFTEQVNKLLVDHSSLSEFTSAFSETVDMILNDAVIPQDIFITHLDAFICRVKTHLEMEDREVLPFLDKALAPNDWQKIELLWQGDKNDPLFGDTIADKYKQLAQRLKLMSKESI